MLLQRKESNEGFDNLKLLKGIIDLSKQLYIFVF